MSFPPEPRAIVTVDWRERFKECNHRIALMRAQDVAQASSFEGKATGTDWRVRFREMNQRIACLRRQGAISRF